MKKILSGVFIAAYLLVYTAPIGFCVTSVPKINAAVAKPALRTPAQPYALKLEGDISITKSNPKISLSLRNSDVEQVLRMFADKAGLNIIFHNSVKGQVTLDLVNIPLNNAFKMVMQVADLTYYIENNTMVVIAASAAQSLNLAKQEMMIIPVKYADAAVLADFLNKNIFSLNRPGISNSNIAITNPGSNEILIFGTKNDYLMAQKVVSQFDTKPREEIFVVNHTTPKEMSETICKTLFQSFVGSSSKTGSASSGSSSSPSTPSPSPAPSSPMPGAPSGGATPVGTMTGAAASSGSSSSSSSSGSGSDMALGGSVIACQYNNSVAASNLSSVKNNNLTIAYSPQRGTIQVLGGSAQQMELIRDFILKNDKKQPQAYLEISIIELSESGSREFNNTWNIWSSSFTGTFDGSTHTNQLYPQFIKGDGYTLVDASSYPPKTLQKFIPYTDPLMITYTMNYLIKNGKGRTLANPRIMITNGQQSTIDLVSDYVSSVTASTNTSAAGNVTTYTYNIASDAGIKVELTPFISPDGYVTLNIKPNYATIKEKIPGFKDTAGIIVATLLDRRNLDLKNVRIKDGETLVLGGMIREEEQKNVSKIPVLGDLPGVGFFFRNTNTIKSKQELVIMITPKIIKDSEDIVNNAGTTL